MTNTEEFIEISGGYSEDYNWTKEDVITMMEEYSLNRMTSLVIHLARSGRLLIPTTNITTLEIMQVVADFEISENKQNL